jgi:mannose-1-phosphate guanylyltransferase
MQRKDSSLKAVVLVGGEGTRLRPLTNGLPKSMVPVLNKPFLEHTLAYLKRFGVENVILTVSYLPKVIQDYFGDGSGYEIRLIYSIEENPLGTAGAVKKVERYLPNTFIVLNGDIFTDLNIAEMLAFHRREKAKITIALIQVDNPCAFGVVEADNNGKVKRFIEKPGPENITSNWINAGVYIIEPEVLQYVPANAHYMFEKGLFPFLLEINEPIFGYRFSGYWLDMGTPEKYLCLNRDLLLSKVRSALIPSLTESKMILDRETTIHPSARITGPIVIANGCRIGQRVHIKGPAIIATDCHIGEDAVIEDTVLWAGANVGAGAVLKQCIVGVNTKIKNNDRIINRTIMRD